MDRSVDIDEQIDRQKTDRQISQLMNIYVYRRCAGGDVRHLVAIFSCAPMTMSCIGLHSDRDK